MSFSRMGYDEGAYQHYLRETTGSGAYMLQTPRVDCEGCFYPNPRIRIDRYGGAVCDKNLIDVDSELIGITRRNSRCPTERYIPTGKEFCKTAPMKDCYILDPEDTRISNPPCTLRSTGWNRWEWLCQNPQDHAVVPFQFLINNQQIMKDNHRPLIPTPLDQNTGLPPSTEACPDNTPAPLDLPVPQPDQLWQRCDVISKY